VDPIYLLIGTDPASWYLADAGYSQVVAELAQAGPVVLDVVSPLRGRLVLSVAHAGSVSLLKVPPTVGTHPGDAYRAHAARLYLPTAAGPGKDLPGYELAAGTKLSALEQDIVAAMRDGTPLPVPVTAGLGSGQVVLSGGTLAFAVLRPPDGQG
jgi:hypothetical protein